MTETAELRQIHLRAIGVKPYIPYTYIYAYKEVVPYRPIHHVVSILGVATPRRDNEDESAGHLNASSHQ